MADCKNFSPSPEFEWLCNELFQKIYDTASNQHLIGKPVTVRYLEIITNFIKLWRSTVGNYIYPALRLIIPFRDRRVYNIKENTLIKALCRYLRLPRDSETENRLLRWKQRAARGVKLSDFCVEEIKKRQKDYEGTQKITIDELNGYLDEIKQEGNGKRMGYMALTDSKAFNYCLNHMKFTEMKFFFDIILKTRVISGQENKFLAAWHPDAVDYLSVVSDLDVLSKRLYDPTERLRQTDLSISLSHAFEPQLARRMHVSYERVASRLQQDFIIEEKMDGERLQVHFINYGEQIKYLSRRGVDFSYLYGESSASGPVSPFLKLHPNVKDCILDGEMITYDTKKDIVLPFGLVKSSAMNQIQSELGGIPPTESYKPLFVAFDLVYLNGKSLTNLDIKRRKTYLNKILEPVERSVEIIQYTKATNANEIKESLEQAISMGSEGIVLKQLGSHYSVASRNTDWIKIKPEYLEQFGENMDLLIIGREQGKKDSFICGLSVTDPDNATTTAKPKFISFCTIANGFTEEEFKEIERNTRGKWHTYSEEAPDPKILEFGTKLPHEWIYPEDSIVLEVKARALDNKESEKKKYRSGCTLYFGYCKQIRYDKDWKAVATFSEFEAMKDARNFYNKRKLHDVASSKKKSSKRAKIGILNVTESKRVDPPVSDIFLNYKFRVISDFFDPTKKRRISEEDMCTLILENGGKILYTSADSIEPEENFLIIGEKLTRECKTLVNANNVIIKPSWLFSCIEAGYKLPLMKSDIFAGEHKPSIENFQYTTDISEDTFDELLNAASSGLVEQDPIGDLPLVPLFLLHNLQIAVLHSENCSSALSMEMEFTVRCHGGQIVDSEEASIIVVLNDLTSKSVLSLLRKKIASKAVRESTDGTPRIPRIVDVSWVLDSVKSNCIAEIEKYQCF
ncbi:unnamed protein product [Kluyveromyces dobzhanskii CBS 2104]|uniref:DNA ligase 4 n=1 Tax=Kluyveromyces dobzhanskii CBS 2104 TaxID=1427455 RepID=A0A0A8L5A9_9SACH|nr:unnamed protein product [Kluyveromyces dobzhanskii CBS 2104]